MALDEGYEAIPEPIVSLPGASQANPQKKHPCILCQQRKIKCDRVYPCANCRKAHAECISPSTLPRKRKRRFPEAELLARIRRYEHHLKLYGADIDAINAETSAPSQVVSPNQNIPISPDCAAPNANFHHALSIRRSLKHVENNLRDGMNEEFRDTEELLQGSSSDELFESPFFKTYDTFHGHGADVLFGIGTSQALTELHPPPVLILKLWQIYIDNVDPLCKVFHAPTIQQQIIDAIGDLQNLPKNLEALLFAIYAMAITSVKNEECLALFDNARESMIAKYRSAAQMALNNAEFLRSSDLITLQAFTLYLMSSMQMVVDPRTLFCLTGISVRIAQRMGLSSDGTTYGLSPFEVETRRRLWWQIMLIDHRVGELSGAGTAILTYTWNTKLPSNINDSDLYVEMKEPPVERTGCTEVTFVRLRCELLDISREKQGALIQPIRHEQIIKDFEKHIEDDYLVHCDPSIPLHMLVLLFARSAFSKIWSLQTSPMSTMLKSQSPEAQERSFTFALRMLENHNELMSTPRLSRFTWQFWSQFPFPAHLFLICTLRKRTTGPLADRAWDQLAESDAHRETLRKGATLSRGRQTSALHLALANLTLKAWEARIRDQPDSVEPAYIERLRGQRAERKGTPKESPPSAKDEELFWMQADLDLQQGGGQEVTGMGMGMGMEQNSFLMGGGFDQGQMGMGQMGQMMGQETPGEGWDFWENLMQDDGTNFGNIGTGYGGFGQS